MEITPAEKYRLKRPFSDFKPGELYEITMPGLVSEMNLSTKKGRIIVVLSFESEIDKLAFKIKYGGNYV